MSNSSQPRIVSITAVPVPGDRRTFVNLYGLDEQSRVWQWDATDARWRPFRITPKKDRRSNDRGDNPDNW